jgi:hypothetical protein
MFPNNLAYVFITFCFQLGAYNFIWAMSWFSLVTIRYSKACCVTSSLECPCQLNTYKRAAPL